MAKLIKAYCWRLSLYTLFAAAISTSGCQLKFFLLQVQKVAAHIQMLLDLCIMISADRCSAGGAEG